VRAKIGRNSFAWERNGNKSYGNLSSMKKSITEVPSRDFRHVKTDTFSKSAQILLKKVQKPSTSKEAEGFSNTY